jgi:hypothetical protein
MDELSWGATNAALKKQIAFLQTEYCRLENAGLRVVDAIEQGGDVTGRHRQLGQDSRRGTERGQTVKVRNAVTNSLPLFQGESAKSLVPAESFELSRLAAGDFKSPSYPMQNKDLG